MIKVIEYYNFLHQKNKSIIDEINSLFKTIYKKNHKKNHKDYRLEVYRQIREYIVSNSFSNPIFKNVVNVNQECFTIQITLKNNVGLEFYYHEGSEEIELQAVLVKDISKTYRFTPFSIGLFSASNIVFGNYNEIFRICEYKNDFMLHGTPSKLISKKLPIFKRLFTEIEKMDMLDYLLFNKEQKNFEDKLSLVFDVNHKDLSVFKLNLIKKFK